MFAFGFLRRVSKCSFLLVVLGLAILALGPVPAALAAGVVGDGTAESCTEAALQTAIAGGGTVTFNCGLGVATIVLTSTLVPDSSVTLDGEGDIVLHAQNAAHFRVKEGVTLTLEGIALEDEGNAGGWSIHNLGKTVMEDISLTGIRSKNGAIVNSEGATLEINHSTFTNNSSADDGGVINNRGAIKIKNSTFTNNKASDRGGVIYSQGNAPIEIQQSEFVENTAESGGALNLLVGNAKIKNSSFRGNKAITGGAIDNHTRMQIINSTFRNNQARTGGGIQNLETLEFVNSTVANNTAESGGGIANYNTLKIDRSTFSENTSTGFNGGGLYTTGSAQVINSTFSGNILTRGPYGSAIFAAAGDLSLTFVTIAMHNGEPALHGANAQIFLENTIFWKNEVSCSGGAYRSKGHNLADDASCNSLIHPTDRLNTDAKLGPLANNGGPTLTHLPAAGSPALAQGTTVTGISIDQRGVKRPANHPDIGAVEVKKVQ